MVTRPAVSGTDTAPTPRTVHNHSHGQYPLLIDADLIRLARRNLGRAH
jgi:hypothetical protein